MDIDSYCETESQFSSRVWPLVGQPHSNGRPHVREYMRSTHWTWWVKRVKEDMKLGELIRTVDLAGIEGEVDLVSEHTM